MKKLRLDWDAVIVESFATTPDAAAREGAADAREWEALSGPLCGTLATRLTCCPCTPRADGI
jgi:hypothetical protein